MTKLIVGLLVGVIITSALYNNFQFEDLNEVETQCIATFDTIQDIETYENNYRIDLENNYKIDWDNDNSTITIPIEIITKIQLRCAYGITFKDVSIL